MFVNMDDKRVHVCQIYAVAMQLFNKMFLFCSLWKGLIFSLAYSQITFFPFLYNTRTIIMHAYYMQQLVYLQMYSACIFIHSKLIVLQGLLYFTMPVESIWNSSGKEVFYLPPHPDLCDLWKI